MPGMSDISGWGVKGWNMEAVSFIVAWFVSRSGFVCHFRNLVFVYKVTPKIKNREGQNWIFEAVGSFPLL